MNQRRARLSEVLTLARRRVTVEPEALYPEVGVYCFGRGLFHKAPRTGAEVGDKALFLIKERDFILQVTFAWEGAVAVASAQDDGFYGSVRVLTFTVDESACLPEFLQFYFRTEEGLDKLRRISPGSAGRNRVLNKSRLGEVIVPLPPLSEQRRFLSIKKKLDEANTLAQSLHEEMARLLFALFQKEFGRS